MTDNALDDLRLNEQLDLTDRVRELREDLLPEVERRYAEADAQAADPDADDPDPGPGELRSLRDRLEGEATAHERVIRALCQTHDTDDCPGADCEHVDAAFVIQELMTSETALLTDDVTERSVEVDFERQTASGAPKQGFHKVRTLELSIVDAPEGVPSTYDAELDRAIYRVGQLPDHTSDYLYNCAVALNDAQSVEGVGNLSSYGLTPENDSSG